MPHDKKGKKKPYTKANIKKAKEGKGGLTMKKPAKKKPAKKKPAKKTGY